jgi:hypothetical protein
MRFPALFAALFLAACATAPTTATAPTAAANNAAPPPSRLTRLLTAAGGPDAPTLQVMQQELGEPDVSRQDGAGTALTYRLQTCALLLLFTADASNAQRLAEAHPGPRRTGQEAPTLAQCAAEANARPAS